MRILVRRREMPNSECQVPNAIKRACGGFEFGNPHLVIGTH
jgi:hypothetical protein